MIFMIFHVIQLAFKGKFVLWNPSPFTDPFVSFKCYAKERQDHGSTIVEVDPPPCNSGIIGI